MTRRDFITLIGGHNVTSSVLPRENRKSAAFFGKIAEGHAAGSATGIPLRNPCLRLRPEDHDPVSRGLKVVAAARRLGDRSSPATSPATPQELYQPAETLTHRRYRLRRARRQYLIGPPYVFAMDVPVGRRQDESGSASFGISRG
jgi:hypothetical protein